MQGLNKKDKNFIYIYPIFMLRRLFFTFIVLIFYNNPALQV